jgi:DNA polymerase
MIRWAPATVLIIRISAPKNIALDFISIPFREKFKKKYLYYAHMCNIFMDRKIRIVPVLTKKEKLESLEILNYQIRACQGCPLSESRKHALPGEGNVDSNIMIVALSPGAKENIANRMFVGPAGEVLDRLLSRVGIPREKLFMTNLIKCMLPGNRKPEATEIDACGQFLDNEISVIRPELIVPLGLHAAKAVLARFPDGPGWPAYGERIIFGEILELKGQRILPLNHPASLLYRPQYEADTLRKYQRLKSYV